MHTARVTILMPPDKKAAFDSLAAERGMSTGEFFRRAGDREAAKDAEIELELGALVGELEEALPKMHDDLKAMSGSIAEARAAIAAYRAEKAATVREAA